MLRYNKTRKLFEEEFYHYELQDVKEPQLYRDFFPYDDVPKIVFNNRVMPMDPPEDIWITDTTFRDGQQSLPPFEVDDIVHIFDLMHKLDGNTGLIRQTEFFLYTDRDRAAIEKCLARGYKYPEITGWIRAVENDFKLVKAMGLKETGILTSVSDYHIFLKLKWTRRQAMDNYLKIVKTALDNGIIPRCHFEDITRADIYGFVVPFASELMKLAQQYKMPVKIRMCDTMGYGIAMPGAALPRNVNGIVYNLHHFAGVPSEWLEWHGHNDFYRGLTNGIYAWMYGACSVNAAWLGIGERTGNTPIEALIMEYISLRGRDGKETLDTTIITEIARYMSQKMGVEIAAKQPLVGKNFNVTKAGIHADGLMKNEEIYNIFDTKKVLNRPIMVGITDKSGVSGIAFWINAFFEIPDGEKLAKDNPGVVKIKDIVDKQYVDGRIIGIADEEMITWVKEYLPEIYKKFGQNAGV
ncbi:MAG TPA: 2-isopropylmalate synthase [Candidatus Goldiibacteriota bacterium]|nr:2-isopropylmalate synthase [Candidatus Goldiibacteriota bacterium]HPN63928.1 2-isopropylmalate synthase [Candidatus Goldiibacteriota bacterium]HRQ43615.1 2-isopropylmalate synthase [Candidatus Goldiibacteriota bacterium]